MEIEDVTEWWRRPLVRLRQLWERRPLRVTVVAAWYDCWLGGYYDRQAGALYVMVPFVGLRISRPTVVQWEPAGPPHTQHPWPDPEAPCTCIIGIDHGGPGYAQFRLAG